MTILIATKFIDESPDTIGHPGFTTASTIPHGCQTEPLDQLVGPNRGRPIIYCGAHHEGLGSTLSDQKRNHSCRGASRPPKAQDNELNYVACLFQ